jgi:hypothetical protein
VISIGGRKHWLWRAVNQDGNFLDEFFQTHCDTKAARRLLVRLLARLCTKLVVISGSTERLGVNQFVAVCVLASSIRSDSNRWMSKFPDRNNERGDAVPHILRHGSRHFVSGLRRRVGSICWSR